MNEGIRLDTDFFQSTDVVSICKKLIGKVLVSIIDNHYTSGIIVEAEAYRAPEDKASHAYNNRRTARTEVMFQEGGHAYIYLCYGIHHLFNVVTAPAGIAHAVLIRALEPLDGLEIMMERRSLCKLETRITKGPGSLATALGLRTSMTGESLIQKKSKIYMEDRGIKYPSSDIIQTPRIGVGYAEECAHWPWRFYVKNNNYVSATKS